MTEIRLWKKGTNPRLLYTDSINLYTFIGTYTFEDVTYTHFYKYIEDLIKQGVIKDSGFYLISTAKNLVEYEVVQIQPVLAVKKSLN